MNRMKWLVLFLIVGCILGGCLGMNMLLDDGDEGHSSSSESEIETETETETEIVVGTELVTEVETEIGTETELEIETGHNIGGSISMEGNISVGGVVAEPETRPETKPETKPEVENQKEETKPKPESAPVPESKPETPPTNTLSDRRTKDSEKVVVFANGYPEGWWARNDRGNGGMFNCSFANAHAKVENGLLSLILNNSPTGYIGAEFRTHKYSGYGFYSTSMKPVKKSGVISSFFIYTGNPWDEIDIEFLGNDTTKVQFNYFTNGVGGHEYVYDLGFDASTGFHEYAFEWRPDCIIWYVDGKAVHKATVDIPSHEGQVMMNLWNTGDEVSFWAGKFEGTDVPLVAQYEWIGISSVLSTENK